MSADTPARLALLRELRDEILLHYSSGRPAVAVDGLDGTGTERFADDLAETFAERGHAVVRAGMNGFRPARGERPAELAYGDWYDLDAFRDALVMPFRRGAEDGFRLAVVDESGDPAGEEPSTTAPDAVLIVDGPFLLQSSLAGLWNYSIALEVPRETLAERATASDGASADTQRLYVAEVRPRTRAVAIVDNTDLDTPVRRFADSC